MRREKGGIVVQGGMGILQCGGRGDIAVRRKRGYCSAGERGIVVQGGMVILQRGGEGILQRGKEGVLQCMDGEGWVLHYCSLWGGCSAGEGVIAVHRREIVV